MNQVNYINQGYIYLWRSFLSTSFFKDSVTVHLAIYLLLRACHKPNKILFNGDEIIIDRGQVLIGRNKVALEIGVKPSTVRNKLLLLEKVRFLDIKSNNKFSIVTICKYGDYQVPSVRLGQQVKQQLDNNLTTTGQQLDNNLTHTINEKKEKNEKNERNEKNKDKNICEVLTEEQVLIKDIVDDFNQVCGTKNTYTAKETVRLIKARLKEGRTLEDFKIVHRKKFKDWRFNPDMCRYLSTDTLYSGKFNKYLNQLEPLPVSEATAKGIIVGREWLKKKEREEKNGKQKVSGVNDGNR